MRTDNFEHGDMASVEIMPMLDRYLRQEVLALEAATEYPQTSNTEDTMTTSIIQLDQTFPGILGTTYGQSAGTVTITTGTNALLFDVQLNQSIVPTFFHGGDVYNANTFGVSLDLDS
jgi:hypothetical protein